MANDNVDMGVSRLKILKGGDRKPSIGANVARVEAPAGNPGATAAQAKAAESDSFNRHYNKELKVSEGKSPLNLNALIDEIPLVLLELNESALLFIQKEQFENALLLLQKAHGVLDVVDISRSRRDQMIAL